MYDLYGKIEPYEKEKEDGAKKGIGRSFWHDGDEALAMIWVRQLRDQRDKQETLDAFQTSGQYSLKKMAAFNHLPLKQGKEEEAIMWLKKFLRTVEIHKLSEQECFNLLFRLLNGSAFDWLCEEVPLFKKKGPMASWERWSNFLLRFAQCFVIRSGYNMRHQVRLRTQRKREDVKSYYKSLVALAERIRPPIDDEFLKVEFVLGLRSPAAQQVAKMAAAAGKSSKLILDVCVEFENREKRKALREQLMTAKQQLTDTVTAYAANFEAIANKMYPRMNDMDLLDFFVAGLRDDQLRDHVQRALPNSVPEAIQIALSGCK